MAQSKLEIQISAKNNASPALKAAANDIKALEKSAGKAVEGLGSLAPAVTVAGLATMAVNAGMAAYEMSRLAAASADVEASFKTLASGVGQSSSQMLDALRESSRGGISDFNLMLNANRAMMSGVADNINEMVALMDVARARSQAVGISTTDAFQDLITGISRGSTQILDNLNIFLDAETVYGDYAESIGKTVKQLTAQEQKQAMVNAVLRESADLVKANAAAGDDQSSKFEKLDAVVANTKVNLGELWSPAVTGAMALAAVYLTQQMGLLEGEIDLLNKAWVGAKNFALGTNDLTNEQIKYAQAAGEADAITHNLTFGLTNLGTAGHVAADGLTAVELKAANLTTRLAGLKAQSDATRAALAGIESSAIASLQAAASGAVGVMGASAVSGIYGPAAEKLKQQIKVLEDLGYSTDEIRFKSEELATKLGLPFTGAVEAARLADKEAKAYAKTLSGDVSDAEREAEQAFNSLRSKVAGVLSQALDPGVGVDPDEILEKMGIPRPDDLNENARRLADIAKNGLMGQEWLSNFKREVPDIWNMIRTAANPQEEAAHLLRDFQDGLLSSPIDRGRAKEIIKRMIKGEENMASLATELANEIAAEMGVPLQQALGAAQSVLGGGPAGGAGGEAGRSFSDGAKLAMSEAGGGGAMVDEFITQAKANYSKLSSAGAEAGRMWGSGFLAYVGENVPPALIQILTDLVTPAVAGRLAQQATLTNAVP